MNDYSKVINYLKENLSDKRFEHTLAVAKECMYYADIFGLDDSKKDVLYRAALFHDITKEKTPEEQIELCRVYNIKYDRDYIHSPSLFHSKTGGVFGNALFPEFCTKDVQEIISTHTTGCENMSLMQKILFLADYTEETRKHTSCIKLRDNFHSKAAASDNIEVLLNQTLVMSFDNTIDFLKRTEKPINIETIKARNYLLKTAR